jgi:hypothetical protein
MRQAHPILSLSFYTLRDVHINPVPSISPAVRNPNEMLTYAASCAQQSAKPPTTVNHGVSGRDPVHWVVDFHHLHQPLTGWLPSAVRGTHTPAFVADSLHNLSSAQEVYMSSHTISGFCTYSLSTLHMTRGHHSSLKSRRKNNYVTCSKLETPVLVFHEHTVLYTQRRPRTLQQATIG